MVFNNVHFSHLSKAHCIHSPDSSHGGCLSDSRDQPVPVGITRHLLGNLNRSHLSIAPPFRGAKSVTPCVIWKPPFQQVQPFPLHLPRQPSTEVYSIRKMLLVGFSLTGKDAVAATNTQPELSNSHIGSGGEWGMCSLPRIGTKQTQPAGHDLIAAQPITA